MRFAHRRFLHLSAGAAALAATSRVAQAQGYPLRPVRVLVGLAAVILVVLGSMHAALAQQTPYRMGLVSPGSASSMAPRVEALKNGLRDHGYVEGRNITIEYRWGDGEDQRVPGLVSDLMNLKVDLFLTHGVRATRAARNASATIPIVCFDCGDLVATSLVESLSRPGGNITG